MTLQSILYHRERYKMYRTDAKYNITTIKFPEFSQGRGVYMSCTCNGDSSLIQTMSQAAEYDFNIQKGATLDFNIVYKDSSKRPVNLTGYKAKCVAQYNTKTFTINATIENPCHGCIRLYMSPYETSRIFTLDYKYTSITEYTYQLNLISPSNISYRILNGKICVSPAAGS